MLFINKKQMGEEEEEDEEENTPRINIFLFDF